MSTRVFAKPVSVYVNAQKKLGESTQPIGRTRPMQMMQPSYPGADGTYPLV